MMKIADKEEKQIKKVGIITLYYNNDNYGGIAQAYALNEYISRLGFRSELISYKRSKVHQIGTKERIAQNGLIRVLKEKLEYFPQKFYYRTINKKAQQKFGETFSADIEVRKQAFAKSREIIPHSEIVTEDTIAQKLGNTYDYYVSGSDQIWKPGVFQKPYIFTFLDDAKKRLSYASSITVTDIPEEYGAVMREGLKHYEWISVREQSAKKYLESVTDRKIDVVVDPTLLLSEDDWNGVTAERQITEKYLFAYFLGDNQKQREKVKELAKKKKLKIVTLPHVEGMVRAADLNFGDIELYDVDLAQFLSLIKYADYVCTDSFHAVVFSNIFETNFSVFERIVFSKRSNMNSRLETLLSSLHEEDCFVGRYGEKIKEQAIDFCNVKKNIQPQIDRSQKLLKNALMR